MCKTFQNCLRNICCLNSEEEVEHIVVFEVTDDISVIVKRPLKPSTSELTINGTCFQLDIPYPPPQVQVGVVKRTVSQALVK